MCRRFKTCSSRLKPFCAKQKGFFILNKYMTKQELRLQIKEKLASLGPAHIRAESKVISQHIINSKLYKCCTTLLAYMPLADEVDITPVIHHALSTGKKVYLPRIFSGTNDMEFYQYTEETTTEKDIYGIVEPAADKAKSFTKLIEKMSIQQYSPAAQASEHPEHVLILVPGRAFTKDGKRLGRGKGFYDVYLSKIPGIFNIKKSGVCFACQILADLPTTPDDILMDTVVECPKGVSKPISGE